MASRMFYIYPEALPSPNARTTTIVKSCESIQHSFNLTLVTITSSKDKKNIENAYGANLDNINFKYLKRKVLGIGSNIFFNFYLKKLLKKEEFCYIYVRHLKTAYDLINYRKLHKKNWRIIFESHEIFHKTLEKKNKTTQIKKTEGFIYKNADFVVFIAKSLQEDINQIFSINNTKNQIVLPLGFETLKTIPIKDFSKIEEVYYIGSLHPWKGVDTLIEAMREVSSPIKLKIIGRASEDRMSELQSLISKYNLNGRVEISPPMPHSEVINLLKTKTKLCVLPNCPSPFERYTSPLKLFEYMGTNNIIVYSDIDSIQDIIEKAEMGIGFEPGDAKDLGKEINNICQNPSKYVFLANNAFDLSHHYSWSSRAKVLSKFLNSNTAG